MNIIFYTDTPNYGGAEKQMELLAKYLKPLGCRVSLACGKYSKLKDHISELKKVYANIHLLPAFHKHDPRHYTELKKLFKKEKFDLIHIHLWNPGSCRYAFFVAKKTGLPIVTTEHDPFDLSGLKKIIKQKCLSKTDQIITISSDNFRQISQYGKDIKNRLHRVSNGIEIDKFLDNHDKVSLPVQHGDFVITCIAELHPRKGQKYLIRAFKELHTEIPKLHLMLVGTGPDEANLKSRYANIPNLHFLGWRDDIPQILKSSDIFVLPSLREAFGLVLIEAMASGVITVATNNGGTTDIIEHGKSGFLVPPANSDAIADTIRMILKDPDKKKNIEKAAIERVKEMFIAQKMAYETFEIYKKCLFQISDF